MSFFLYQASAEPPPGALTGGDIEDVRPLAAMGVPVFPLPFVTQNTVEMREPLWFGDVRMNVDWETPFGIPVLPPEPITQVMMPLVREEDPERISSEWDVPLSVPVIVTDFQDYELTQFVNQEEDEEVAPFIDKWDNPLMRVLPVLPDDTIAQYPTRFEPDEPVGPEDITLDKWYQRLSEPVIAPHQLVLDIGVLDPLPLPDEDLLPKRIPWWDPLSVPVWPLDQIQDTNDRLVNLTTDEFIFVESYDRMSAEVPWTVEMPIALYPFRNEVESSEPEVITLDKWYVPFDQNFHTLPDAPLPQIDALVWLGEAENITLDKWYQALSEPVWPLHHLRLPMHEMYPEPIPNIPGVYEWWLTSMDIPWKLFTQDENDHNEYTPLWLVQYFQVETEVEPCENPRRRSSEQTGSCASELFPRRVPDPGTTARRRTDPDSPEGGHRKKPPRCDDERHETT